MFIQIVFLNMEQMCKEQKYYDMSNKLEELVNLWEVFFLVQSKFITPLTFLKILYLLEKT